jgi:hypothetical protein
MGPNAGVDYITSPYVDSRVDSNTCTMGNPTLESTLTLCPSLTCSAYAALSVSRIYSLFFLIKCKFSKLVFM